MPSPSDETAFQQLTEAAAVAGRGEYKGIQRGSVQTPDLVFFNDPAQRWYDTGVGLRWKLITVRKIRLKIARSGANFAK